MLSRILLIVAACGLLFAQPNELNLRQDPPAAVQSNQVNAVYTGTAGGTTYYYWVVTRYPIGFSVPVSPVVVARAASSLGGGNSVALTWPAMAGASSYDVLRTSTPAAPSSCTCAVTLATTSTTLTDNGGGLSAWPPAGLHAAGSSQMVLQINNRDGGAPYITMAVQNAQRVLNYQLGLLKNGPVPSYVPNGFIQTYANQYGRLACVDSDGNDCLNSVYNVMNYGCVGDGVADDSECIQRTVNALPARGGTVFLPIGTYLIGTGINLASRSNILFQGECWAMISENQTPGDPAPCSLLKASAAIEMFYSTGTTNALAWEKIHFYGSASSGGKGIHLANPANDPYITDVFMDNFGDQAILIDGGLGGLIYHTFVQGALLVRTGRTGRVGVVELGTTVTDFKILASDFTASVTGSGNVGSGYLCGGLIKGSTNRVEDSVFHLSQSGLCLEGATGRNIVVNTRADLNQGNGFEIHSPTNNFVSCDSFRNSQSANNSYGGFNTSSNANTFSANRSEPLNSDALKQSYGFVDSATGAGSPNYYYGNTARFNVSGQYSFTGGAANGWVAFDDTKQRWVSSRGVEAASRLVVNSTAAPADNRIFDWVGNTDGSTYSQLLCRIANDADNTTDTWCLVMRSGAVLSYVMFPKLKIGSTSSSTLNGVLTGTATWDPGNMAADGDSVSTTVTATGIAADGTWSCFGSLTTIGANNVIVSAFPQAADTARFSLLNKTGGAIDITSGTARVSCFKF